MIDFSPILDKVIFVGVIAAVLAIAVGLAGVYIMKTGASNVLKILYDKSEDNEFLGFLKNTYDKVEENRKNQIFENRFRREKENQEYFDWRAKKRSDEF